ncbi:MAG: hypothetical protein WAW41_01020 [Methylobacter sp.]
MGLETGTYISDLVATNPLGTDLKSAGDDHIRLLKSTIKATFPNINAAVTATDDQINTLLFAAGKNRIINGNFDFWQRGTSHSASGYGSDDRWSVSNSGSTFTNSRQTFTLGQTDVPGNPKYYSRTAVTTSAGAGNYCFKSQKIEGVENLSGQNAVLTFYAKADASKNISIELVQQFGSGGAPSADVTAIGVNKVGLTTSWQKFTLPISVSSISGKNLGTGGDDRLNLLFWFDAGSTYNARTDTLGQKSGTFDIAQVQIEAGSASTYFEKRPLAAELALCQRYYEKSFLLATAPVQNAGGNTGETVYPSTKAGALTIFSQSVLFRTEKRGNPTLTSYNPAAANAQVRDFTAGADCSATSLTSFSSTALNKGFVISATGNAATVVGGQLRVHWTADAEL